MNPDIVIHIIQKLKTLTTTEECKAFSNEFKKYEQFLEKEEVIKIKEEILSQIIKIKGWGK